MVWCPDGECVDSCKEGFFVDKESQECEPCHRTCRACGGPQHNDCDTCVDGYTLKKGECLEGRQICPEKHFRNSMTIVNFLIYSTALENIVFIYCLFLEILS